MESGGTFAGEFHPSNGETGMGGIMAGCGSGHRGFPAVQTDVAGGLHVFAQLLFALALALLLLPRAMSSGDGAARAAAGMRSNRGSRDNGGTGCFMGGFIGMGQGWRIKSSLHFVSMIKVQAALEMTEAYSSSITVSKTV